MTSTGYFIARSRRLLKVSVVPMRVPVTVKELHFASLVVVVMTYTTLYVGPGLGVEANYVTMQTSGKTLIVTIRDAVAAARMLLKPHG